MVGGGALIAGIFLFVYTFLDSSPHGMYGDDEAKKLELQHLETKLKHLESDLALNQNIIQDIKGSVKDILKAQEEDKTRNIKDNRKYKSAVNKTMATIDKADTIFAHSRPNPADIDMTKVYDAMTFDNPDGGVWKQGWDVTYEKSQWSAKKKLKVFVVPHSHNDPGWIKTFERYYHDQTKNILNQIVAKLEEYPKMKFIWAEISYLSMWWAEQSLATKNSFINYSTRAGWKL